MNTTTTTPSNVTEADAIWIINDYIVERDIRAELNDADQAFLEYRVPHLAEEAYDDMFPYHNDMMWRDIQRELDLDEFHRSRCDPDIIAKQLYCGFENDGFYHLRVINPIHDAEAERVIIGTEGKHHIRLTEKSDGVHEIWHRPNGNYLEFIGDSLNSCERAHQLYLKHIDHWVRKFGQRKLVSWDTQVPLLHPIQPHETAYPFTVDAESWKESLLNLSYDDKAIQDIQNNFNKDNFLFVDGVLYPNNSDIHFPKPNFKRTQARRVQSKDVLTLAEVEKELVESPMEILGLRTPAEVQYDILHESPPSKTHASKLFQEQKAIEKDTKYDWAPRKPKKKNQRKSKKHSRCQRTLFFSN